MRHSINPSSFWLVLPAAACAVTLVFAGCDEGSSRHGGPGAGGGDTTSSSSSSAGSGSSGSGSSSSSSGGSSGAMTMIDTMEDGDGSILPNAGLQGAWYTYNDKTAGATQTPPEMTPFVMSALNPPRNGSAFAANTNGSGFTTWGAGFGFDLNNNGTSKGPYDASAFTGITFWAKIGAGAVGAIRVNIGDKNTTPEANICAVGKCSDDFGKDITLTEQWQQFTIPFADMKQVGWSTVILPAIDKASLYTVHFQTGAKATFDTWIDDIAFTQ